MDGANGRAIHQYDRRRGANVSTVDGEFGFEWCAPWLAQSIIGAVTGAIQAFPTATASSDRARPRNQLASRLTAASRPRSGGQSGKHGCGWGAPENG